MYKGYTERKDAVSLLIYLANKGYLSIKELPGKEIDLIGSRGFVIEKMCIRDSYNDAYIKDFNKEQNIKMNNIITLNFYTEDLNTEYSRIKVLNIGEISDIMYVNITEPYYYFTIKDPEGNLLEICGESYIKEI